jgi:hypothetical protein
LTIYKKIEKEMNMLLKILSIVSRIPGLLCCFSAIILGFALVGEFIGAEGPLNLGPYSIETNTIEGLSISLIGTVTSIMLAWLFMVQFPYLCIQRVRDSQEY